MKTPQIEIVPDSQHKGLVGLLPAAARPYALLARFDRPIGWWLLFWPCAWGVLLAGGAATHWPLILWMLVGAIAMRGAGCVYNDVVDRDLDGLVERTRLRPVASGAVSPKSASIWLILLSLIGLVVLLALDHVDHHRRDPRLGAALAAPAVLHARRRAPGTRHGPAACLESA